MASVFIHELTAYMEDITRLHIPGASRDYVKRGLKMLPYKRRCIYFREYQNRVVIVRVLHEKQDISTEPFG